jgi:hypothetical protein
MNHWGNFHFINIINRPEKWGMTVMNLKIASSLALIQIQVLGYDTYDLGPLAWPTTGVGGVAQSDRRGVG